MLGVPNEMWTRWYSLLTRYHESEGFKIQSRLKVFGLSLFAFNRNFEELIRSINSACPDDEPKNDTVFEFADRISPKLDEICRCLQNFVSAAMTLVDQTRVLYNEQYSPRGLIPEYQTEIDKRFLSNGLHQFIQGLRNITVHCRLPNIGYSEHRSFVRGQESHTYIVYLQRDELLSHFDWKPLVRKYIEGGPEKIDLETTARVYHCNITDFHRWFSERQQETHKDDLDMVCRLKAELRDISREMQRLGEEAARRVMAQLEEQWRGEQS